MSGSKRGYGQIRIGLTRSRDVQAKRKRSGKSPPSGTARMGATPVPSGSHRYATRWHVPRPGGDQF
jgi:hypothetical protein